MGNRTGSGGRMDQAGAMGRRRQVRDLVRGFGRNRHDARFDRKARRRRNCRTSRDPDGIRMASRPPVGSVSENSWTDLTVLLFARPDYLRPKNSAAVRAIISGCSIGRKWPPSGIVTTLPFTICAAILSAILIPVE